LRAMFSAHFGGSVSSRLGCRSMTILTLTVSSLSVWIKRWYG
jgi:hypothetical protein